MILRKCLRTLPHQACRVLSGKGDSGSKYRSTVGRKGANPRLDDVTNEKSLETASLFSDDVPVPENEPEFDLIAEEGIFAEELPMFAGEIPIPSGKIPTPSKKNPVGAPAEKYIRKEQEVEIQKSVTKFGNTYEPFTNNSMYLKTRDQDLENERRIMLRKLGAFTDDVIEMGKLLTNTRKAKSVADVGDKSLFNVRSLFTLREMFESRVHLGHSIGCWHPGNKKYLFGTRNDMHIIDLASTEQHLWRVLDLMSQIAVRGGSFLFVNNRPGYQSIVQKAAEACSEAHSTSVREVGFYQQLDFEWLRAKGPDLVICSSCNSPRSQQLLLWCNKYRIPTVGIVDSDVDPVNLTYVIPGNDDSAASILFFHKTFATAIQRGKATKELLKKEEATKKAMKTQANI